MMNLSNIPFQSRSSSSSRGSRSDKRRKTSNRSVSPIFSWVYGRAPTGLGAGTVGASEGCLELLLNDNKKIITSLFYTSIAVVLASTACFIITYLLVYVLYRTLNIDTKHTRRSIPGSFEGMLPMKNTAHFKKGTVYVIVREGSLLFPRSPWLVYHS